MFFDDANPRATKVGKCSQVPRRIPHPNPRMVCDRISVEPIETTVAHGKKLIEYRGALTVAAIKRAVAQP
jgi:hypothetical protein